MMAATYTAVISQEGPWWVGWVEEVPGVNAQEQSRDELLASLRLVLREALEFNREEARRSAAPPATTRLLALAGGWQSILVAPPGAESPQRHPSPQRDPVAAGAQDLP